MKDTILYGDCRHTLDILKGHITTGICDKPRMCITSPPYYGLRDYGGEDKQIGQEDTPEKYISNLVDIFREVRNCLTDDGTLIFGAVNCSSSEQSDWIDEITKETGLPSRFLYWDEKNSRIEMPLVVAEDIAEMVESEVSMIEVTPTFERMELTVVILNSKE